MAWAKGEGSLAVKTVYLAGSMDPEVGAWRDDVTDVVSVNRTDDRLIVLDPRTPEYSPLLHQKHSDPLLDAIFDWEMRGVQLADQVVFYFAGGSRAPISLLELGIVHLRGPQVIVGCDPAFWRFAYVRDFCTRFQIPFKTELNDIGVLARYRL